MPLPPPQPPIPRPIPPPPPRIPCIILPAISLKPRLLVLLAFIITLIWLLSVKRPTIAAVWKRGSVISEPAPGMSAPPPAIVLPNHPCIIPERSERSMMVSSSPSSIPVNFAWSDFFSTTFTFSTSFAGMFFEASCGSSRKKVFPSMVIFLIVSPLAVMEPSDPTSTPGSFFRSCSSISLSDVLKEEAVYSIVSFFTMIGLPTAETLAASRTLTSSAILMVPRSIFFSTTISFSYVV